MSQYFEVHPDNPQPRLLKQAAQILQQGGIAAVPTDSSYALVCRLDDKAAAQALRHGLGGSQVTAEDGRQRMAVGQVEVAERGDRDVQLHRVDAVAEQAFAAPALQDRIEHLHQRRVHVLDPCGALQVRCAMQVLAVEQRDEFGVLEVVIPREGHQPPDRLDGLHGVEVQRLLGTPDIGIHALEDGQEQVVLAREVVVDQPLVDLGPLGNAVHARTRQSVAGEFIAGREQDRSLRPVGIAQANVRLAG